MSDSKIAQIHRIKNNLWAIDEMGKTLLYVYEGNERVLLLDTGFGLLDLKSLVQGLCPGKEIVVFNTHAHGDHNSGNRQFDVVHVGRMDEPFSHSVMDAQSRQRFRQSFFEGNPRAAGADYDLWKPGPCKKILPVQDGDVVDLGGCHLQVLETPGHSLGSICLFDRENGYLFTGDMMLTWQVWGQLDFSTALLCYGRSLDRLAALEPEVTQIFPAHGVPDNPFGWPVYALPARTLSVYAQGVRRILEGKDVGKPFACFAKDGLVVPFEIGGMVYDPDRLGL